MWIYVYSWGRKGGEQHVASCWGTEDRLEATSHPCVTHNSLNLPVSSPTFIQANQYLLHKRWRSLFSPARVCGFITIIIPKHRFGTNLPCCTTLISLHIKTENKEKKMWFHRHAGLNYHLTWFKTKNWCVCVCTCNLMEGTITIHLDSVPINKCIKIDMSTSIKVAWRLRQHKDHVNFPYRMPLNLLM